MPKLANPTNKQKRAMLNTRWSKWVREHGKCEMNGWAGKCQGDLTNSHIISRTYVKVQFDPRNQQCACGSEHGILGGNPILFSRFVEQSSCGQYVDVMLVQANATTKPDYDLWFKIYDIVTERKYNIEQAREWLGQNIMSTIYDLAKLD